MLNDMKLILALAEMSALAYRDTLDVCGPPAGFRVVDWFRSDETDTDGLVFHDGSAMVIAFSGSNSRQDWLSNLRVIQHSMEVWEGNSIPVHRGFGLAVESVYDQIDRIEYENKEQTARIIVTGHSRGGAEAILAATKMSQYRRCFMDCVTFAQPMVARGRDIERWFDGRYLRVVNGSDAVPRQPFAPWAYSHAGRELYLSNGGLALLDPPSLTKFGDRLFTFQQRGTDHRIGSYLRALRNITA